MAASTSQSASSTTSATNPWGDERETYRMLFVCTGNTCRSPMAEALAKHLLHAYPEHQPKVRVLSAGIATADGLAAAPEAQAAIKDMGIDHTFSTSRKLTTQLISGADVIYAMSDSHLQAVLSIDPDAVSKVKKLDPAGGDIPDPIGQPLAVYASTAHTLEQLIDARLKELFT